MVDLRVRNDDGWNTGLVNSLFTYETANFIPNILWPDFECMDKLLWQGTKVGNFSVGRCYDLNLNLEGNIHNLWEKLWHLQVHAQLKLFLWRVFSKEYKEEFEKKA